MSGWTSESSEKDEVCETSKPFENSVSFMKLVNLSDDIHKKHLF